MACCVTHCNECEKDFWNMFMAECPDCGSKNIDREHEPDIYDEDFSDYDKD